MATLTILLRLHDLEEKTIQNHCTMTQETVSFQHEHLQITDTWKAMNVKTSAAATAGEG